MDISLKTRRLQKIFNSDKELQKSYGTPMARKIQRRMAVLKNAPNLSCVPTTPSMRLHQLTGDRELQFAIDLAQPHRLVFAPNHEPMPTREDGGLDRSRITAIVILEIVDYH